MRILQYISLCALIAAPALWAQNRGQEQAPISPAFTVIYIEVAPNSKGVATSALKQYRETSRKEQGYGRMEFFEQTGRSGHFVVIETWSDQKALDAHVGAAHTKQLLAQLQPIKLSEHDQRPYKTLAVGPPPAAGADRAVYGISHV